MRHTIKVLIRRHGDVRFLMVPVTSEALPYRKHLLLNKLLQSNACFFHHGGLRCILSKTKIVIG